MTEEEVIERYYAEEGLRDAAEAAIVKELANWQANAPKIRGARSGLQLMMRLNGALAKVIREWRERPAAA